MKNPITPTNREVTINAQDFIVSKTDLKGRIVYANRLFMETSGYREVELLGEQHNIVRHPDMPRGVFNLLWQTIMQGQECFAYVKNLCKNGDYYWVLANITPDFDARDKIIGYYSVRRRPTREAVAYFTELYRDMHAAEQRAGSREAISASTKILEKAIKEQGFDNYESFILSHPA
ncbi:MAG: PAS domain-containing protein [Candidatus Thiodiazotropha sp.]